MKNGLGIFISILTLFVFSSCGIIETTRYGNGLKLNTEIFSKTTIDSGGFKKALQKSRERQGKQSHQGQEKKAPYAAVNKEVVEEIEHYKNVASQQKKGERPVPQAVNAAQRNKSKADTARPETKPVYSNTKTKASKPPVEKNAKLAGFMYFGSYLLNLIFLALLSVESFATMEVTLFLVYVLPGLGMLIGFVLAIIAISKIKTAKKEGKKLRGFGISVAIISLFGISVLIALFYLVLIVFLILLLL